MNDIWVDTQLCVNLWSGRECHILRDFLYLAMLYVSLIYDIVGISKIYDS